MVSKKTIKQYYIYIALFIFLNIINTYMLTIQNINRYIAPFRHTFIGEINSFLGNFSVLFFLLLIMFLIFKNAKSRMKSLFYVTLFLNIIIYFLGLFNLFFGTSFSMASVTIFKNPAGGFALGVIVESLLELITYWRIIVFIPFIVLWIFYLKSNKEELKAFVFPLRIKRYFSGFLSIVLILYSAVFIYYNSYQNTLPLNAVKSTFAIQNLGVYPYYIGELLGEPFELNYRSFLSIESDEELAEKFQLYNKNRSSYTNFFDQQIYSNRLTTNQAVDGLFVDPSIANGDQLHGILADRNIVLVQIESLNHFLLEIDSTNAFLPFLNQIMQESFVFNHFYNNVGMGVSSDGELAVLTGLYPMGDRTLYWDYQKINYELNSIINYFNEKDYYTKAIHGDVEDFYNRDIVYPNLFKFDEFYSLEDFISDGYNVKNGYVFNEELGSVHHSPWVSDYYLADYVHQYGHTFEDDMRFMMFPVTMMPHTPFDYGVEGTSKAIYPQYADLISTLTLKYINYTQYYDDTIKRFFVGDQNESQILDNTVYIFYSDHGSGLKNGDLDILYDRELSVLETRQILQQGIGFIYVPGDENIDLGGFSIRKGLLTGQQNLVRSQVDLYRTIIELFDLPAGTDSYFGVHGLSKEPTFALDNRLMDVVLDDYFYSMRNKANVFPKDQEVSDDIFNYIFEFKLLSDYLLTKGNMQAIVNQAILDLGDS
jgi:lipoteichoic acid synthase